PGQRPRAQQRAGPGAEVAGAESRAHRGLDVGVEVRAAQIARRAARVQVLEYVVPRLAHHLAQDAGEDGAFELVLLPAPVLAAEVEQDARARDAHVPPAQGGEPEAAVLRGVDLAARTERAGAEHRHRAGHRLLARQARAREIA